MNVFERLEELTDAKVEIEGNPGSGWRVFIRPRDGGFPLKRGEAETLPEAARLAVEAWEAL